MDISLEVKELPDGKLVTLTKGSGVRSKYLFYVEGLVFLIVGIYVVIKIVNESASGLNVLLFAIGAVICFIAAFRFLRAATLKEELLIRKNELQIINSALFTQAVQRLDVSGIRSFRFLSKPELTDHPLAGKNFDYLGFQTEQKVINEMHGDHQLAIDYDGELVLFGKDIVSWEYDELVHLIGEITGRTFKDDIPQAE